VAPNGSGKNPGLKKKKMKRKNLYLLVFSLLIFPFSDAKASDAMSVNTSGWKAGVARVVITPEELIWMSGYSSRDHPAEGTLTDLWAKALVIEDARGEKAVMISTDVRGMPGYISTRVRNRLKEKYNLSKDQILLNSSHTHTGPVMYDMVTNFSFIYPRDEQQQQKIQQYSIKLENDLVNLVGEALNSMVPVQISSGNGVARFAVNRRNNNESTVDQLAELQGPIDHAVPVLKIEDEAGKLIAIAFGYACHPTVLNIYKWSGDYPGFAQLELEKTYPGVTALFFQGAGGDQNPMPRRSVPLAKQYGQELAAAVKRVLSEEMDVQPPKLNTAYSEVELPLNDPPTKAELSKMVEESSGTTKVWATRLLGELYQGKNLWTSYPYPVQVWQVGKQPIMSLGGELVVEYAINIKRLFGQNTFVFGYSNEVMSYIPSATILKEGGYEGARSQMVRGMPGTWKPGIEGIILQEVLKLAEEAGVPVPLNN
jgi:neutral ceramidase